MSNTRDKLADARRGYQHARYPGDLAADVFARLDAGEHHDADERLDAVAPAALQKFHSMRIGRTSPWKPVLAIAAAVGILASTVGVLVYFGRDQADVVVVALNPTTPPVVVTPVQTPKTAVATAEENVDFTIVPSYQSFAFSMPSLTPASIDEYDRQARETASTTTDKTTAGDASSTVQ